MPSSQPSATVGKTWRKGSSQPPKNISTMKAEPVIMWMYSPRKKSAHFIEEYSVWKPPTSSCSASARSKGARLHSASTHTKKIAASSGCISTPHTSPSPNQPADSCPCTIASVSAVRYMRIMISTQTPIGIS